ncbi:MAG: helix-turn-helix transcriptional regulator [Clostridiales bacterium]|nr:helix-turn-helix transcriptional regulator [Clostridiales bacterium]
MSTQTYFENITPQLRSVFCHSIVEPIIHQKISYTYRFLVINEGSCAVTINNSVQVCGKGDVIFLRPRTVYSTEFYPEKFSCYNIVFNFFGNPTRNPTIAEPLTVFFHSREIEGNMIPKENLFCENLYFIDIPAFNDSFVISGMPDTEKQAEKLYSLYKSSIRTNRMRQNAELLKFIINITEYINDAGQYYKTDIVKRIIEYIDEHCEENITCSSIAKQFSYHRSYVNRIVHNYTGYSLHTYITRQKVNRATQLLLESDLPLTEIAHKLSFYDSSHFSKVYQEYTGMKPSDIRKNSGKLFIC